jgi:hypothetical protein
LISSNSRIATKNQFKAWLTPSFKLFTSVSLYTTKKNMIPHHTFYKDGYISSASNGGFSNIKLFFIAYKNFFRLVSFMIYFKVPKLLFTNNMFREEACAINWEHLTKHPFMYKYNYHPIFYKPSKLDDRLPLVFRLFKQSGIVSALVIDSLYHAKTAYYLHRFNFYSVGFVEANKPKYILNSSIPALGDSILSQLFFVRTMLLLKRITLN